MVFSRPSQFCQMALQFKGKDFIVKKQALSSDMKMRVHFPPPPHQPYWQPKFRVRVKKGFFFPFHFDEAESIDIRMRVNSLPISHIGNQSLGLGLRRVFFLFFSFHFDEALSIDINMRVNSLPFSYIDNQSLGFRGVQRGFFLFILMKLTQLTLR